MNLFKKIIALIALVRRNVRNSYFRKKLGRLGSGSSIYPRVIISHPENLYIGEDVSIAPGVYLRASSRGQIIIGDRCAIAEGVRVITPTHDPNILPVISVSINRDVEIGKDV